MPPYAAIYDQVFQNHGGYRDAAGSPGYRLCLKHHSMIHTLGPRVLDFGCGAGFAVELLRSLHFRKNAVGVDISPKMVAAANERMGSEVVRLLENGRAPFDDRSFDVVTCFDVLEHLEVDDIQMTKSELARLVKPGGWLLYNISLRLSGTIDIEGRNLHRTVMPAAWWDDLFEFDEYYVTKSTMALTGWKQSSSTTLA